MSSGIKSKMRKSAVHSEWAELMRHQARIAQELIKQDKEVKKQKHQEVRYIN